MSRKDILLDYLAKGDLVSLNQLSRRLSLQECIDFIFELDASSWTLANSFSKEDLVLTHALLERRLFFNSFLLDTGRLPHETYQLIDRWWQRFNYRPHVFLPDARLLGDYVTNYGPNAFYRSVKLRQKCCSIRKVEPLARALSSKRVWLTGLRASQSIKRSSGAMFERDGDGRLKISPLFYWQDQDIEEYVSRYSLPINRLYTLGYTSIGCAPCSRAVQPGAEPRSGRWWWETEHKECGLHL